ncbi:phage tail tube protein [Pseudonocardia hispaniensis]|uniref:Phage tail tube protein n=1 Tax=Pseudonocardia hispaniensis TaxID=904933 RepID=A0ABW1J8E6_9PSEU
MAGLDAFGTLLERGDGTPTVYTPIANVTNIEGPETERDTYDVTAHDSPDAWREFIGGLKDAGEVTAEINYDPADHDTLLADYADAQPRDWRITWPTGATWALKAILTGFSAEAPHDDKLAAEITLKVSGKPALTPATP